jgi:predicted phosphatase
MSTIAVLDLDSTLHKNGTLFPDCIAILEWLAAHKIPAHIASFNTGAYQLCERLGILQYFRSVHYGPYRTKLDMIRDILREYVHRNDTDVIFFDDDPNNIEHVTRNSYCTAIWCPAGINWESLRLAWASQAARIV